MWTARRSASEEPGAPTDGVRFPARAAWLALGALVIGAFVSVVVGGIVYVLTGEAEAPATAVGAVALYGTVAVAVFFASRWWGSGRLTHDYGLRFRRSDAGWGPLAWVAMFSAAIAVGMALQPFPELQGSNTDVLKDEPSAAMVAVLVVVAVLGAPLFEELLFRGLLLGALRSVMPAAPAVGLQSVAFGLVHVQPDEGLGNLGLMLTLGAVGAVLGVVVVLAKRLGPAVIGHAIFNAVATIATLATD